MKAIETNLKETRVIIINGQSVMVKVYKEAARPKTLSARPTTGGDSWAIIEANRVAGEREEARAEAYAQQQKQQQNKVA